MCSIRIRPVFACLALALSACRHEDGANETALLARVGDARITVGDLEQLVNAKPPYLRPRYANREKLAALLDETVRFEALAEQARRRGYDRDPEVVRAMKQQMVAKLMQKEFEAKHGPARISDADVARYYSEHSAEWNGAEQVRVSEISTRDKAQADKAYAEAKVHAGGAGPDLKAFRELVATYSEDAATRPQGGDLGFFSRATDELPKALVDAAFSLNAVGDVSEPVSVNDHWVVLLLTQRRPGFARTLAQAKDEIRQRLFRDNHEKAFAAFVDDLEKGADVETHPENLAKVRIAADDGAQRVAEGAGSSPRGN